MSYSTSPSDAASSYAEPMARITGFCIAARGPAHPGGSISSTSAAHMNRAPSLLSLNLQASSYGSSKVEELDSESAQHSCDEFSDCDEEGPAGAMRGIPIVQK
jgi:hypothetical protein